jgi:hypothetical protein
MWIRPVDACDIEVSGEIKKKTSTHDPARMSGEGIKRMSYSSVMFDLRLNPIYNMISQ